MSNIHGLSSIKNKADSDSSGSEGEGKRQGFYVGGSNQSGQQVLGPNNQNNIEIVNRLFDSARNAGAEQISLEETNSPINSSRNTFEGGIYRLGGHGRESDSISNELQNNDNDSIIINFMVWDNGFSLDDGPLRNFIDPENKKFLDAVSKGHIPQELILLYPGKKIDFHMLKKNGTFVAAKTKPFSGEGYRLGSVVPHIIGYISSDKTSEDTNDHAKGIRKAQESVILKENEPITKVQVRIPSQQRPVVATFNESHTVADLRNFLVNAYPSLAFQPFQMLQSYPTKVIEDEKKSLKEVGIINTVINLKYV